MPTCARSETRGTVSVTSQWQGVSGRQRLYLERRTDRSLSKPTDTLWQTASTRQITAVTSELTLLEVLVKPLKVGDATTATLFRTVLQHTPEVRMLPITPSLLEQAANLRATLGLRTPDAIHVATALVHRCALMVTNDRAFRRIPDLPVAVLNELVS